MSNIVVNTTVYLYDRIKEKCLWTVGQFQTIKDTFDACKSLSFGMGRKDAFMIPSIDEDDVIYFDSKSENRFCFKIKVEAKKLNNKESKRNTG